MDRGRGLEGWRPNGSKEKDAWGRNRWQGDFSSSSLAERKRLGKAVVAGIRGEGGCGGLRYIEGQGETDGQMDGLMDESAQVHLFPQSNSLICNI